MSEDLDRIVAYLAANHVLSLATARDSPSGPVPWAASCFYVLDPSAMALLLLTEPSTRHGAEMADNQQVAGTVSSQEESVARIKGIQFSGKARLLQGPQRDAGLALYLRRFPIARLHAAPLWSLVLDHIKFTNNTLGFGRKLIWNREAE